VFELSTINMMELQKLESNLIYSIHDLQNPFFILALITLDVCSITSLFQIVQKNTKKKIEKFQKAYFLIIIIKIIAKITKKQN